jgi:subtilisin family serine protease
MVVGNGRVDISPNHLELWYGAQDRLAVSVKPPGGTWIGPIESNQFVENRQLPDGSFVSIYNELYHPANGANTIAVLQSPGYSSTVVKGITAGQWQVRLHGREIKDGRFHGWIERDDPFPGGVVGPQQALWRFPSYFSERSSVASHAINTLACGMRVLAVANLDEARQQVHFTSSTGPTRDERSKPDLAAPGTDIVAAKGFAVEDDLWMSLTGTSMASPYACGVAALLQAHEPNLTAAQILGVFHRTAQPLPGNDYVWKKDSGYGRIDPQAAWQEARTLIQRDDRT